MWVHPDLLEDEDWEIVKTKLKAQQRRQIKKHLRKLKQQEKDRKKQEIDEEAETSSNASLAEKSLPKSPKMVKKFTLGNFMPTQLKDRTTQGHHTPAIL